MKSILYHLSGLESLACVCVFEVIAIFLSSSLPTLRAEQQQEVHMSQSTGAMSIQNLYLWNGNVAWPLVLMPPAFQISLTYRARKLSLR